jgi:hypothetical protein
MHENPSILAEFIASQLPDCRRRVKAVRIGKPLTEHPWRRFASGIGQGGEFWRKQKENGQAARRQLSLGNSGRPPLRSGLPPFPRDNCKPKQLTQ